MRLGLNGKQVVTIILPGDDNRQPCPTYLFGSTDSVETETNCSECPAHEVAMKFLWAPILVLVTTVGCGGYGSGMGSTPAPAPAISPAPGMYSAPLTVSISDTMQNATIYVTTDGSMPTLSSPIYRGPFMLNQSAQVQAIAVAGGFSTSPMTIANFTLQ